MASIASLATPFAAPGGRLIASPFQFATDDNTFLRIVSANAAGGVTLQINGRRIDGNGELQAVSESHTPNTDRSAATQDFKLGKGALLNLAIFANSGVPLIGQTYVSARIMQGSGATAILLGVLLGGVVTATQPLGFPGSPIQASVEVEPVVRMITGTTPSVGHDWSETVPTGARWELLAIEAGLLTNAAAGNRFAHFRIVNGGFVFSETLNPTSQGAAQNAVYSYGPNLPAVADTTFFRWTIPLVQRPILRAGATFGANTFNLDGGDQWSAPNYIVREWLEVP